MSVSTLLLLCWLVKQRVSVRDNELSDWGLRAFGSSLEESRRAFGPSGRTKLLVTKQYTKLCTPRTLNVGRFVLGRKLQYLHDTLGGSLAGGQGLFWLCWQLFLGLSVMFALPLGFRADAVGATSVSRR